MRMDAQGEELPALAPFPPAAVRQSIPLDLWHVCVDSWKSLLHAYVVLSDVQFGQQVSAESSVVDFIITYFETVASSAKPIHDARIVEASTLGQNAVLLACRTLAALKPPPDRLFDWRLLSNICTGLGGSHLLPQLIPSVWSQHQEPLEKSLQTFKAQMVDHLDRGKQIDTDWTMMKRLAHLIRVVPAAGRHVMTGSDFVDSLAGSYSSLEADRKDTAIVVAFLGLSSSLAGAGSKPSLAIDVLYGLVTSAQAQGSDRLQLDLFLQDLVSKTPLLASLGQLRDASGALRVGGIVEKLGKYRNDSKTRSRALNHRAPLSKTRASSSINGRTVAEDAHMHSLNLVTQVQDLFPDLGSAFIMRLLEEYNENVELVTTKLLEDDLPAQLHALDRTSNVEEMPSMGNKGVLQQLPSSPQRRNVFDDDEFDRLTADTSRIHIGRKDQAATADDLLDARNGQASNKAAILSALAAFDADDDERDDTYDLADVGGTVDSIKPDGIEDTKLAAEEAHGGFEHILFRTWRASPPVFARDAATRRSVARSALRKEVGMTDEAIEGWALMLQRDSRRLRALEARYSTFGGQQRALPSSSWRESDQEGSDASGTERPPEQYHGRGGRGRGRGRGSGGRGNVFGPSEDRSTQIARDRKEASKGSRANHNRRNQRARKVARAGFPG